MNVEEIIKQSRWWGLARDMPDRHYPPDAGVSLADHLERVLENLCFLDGTGHDDGYFGQFVQTLPAMGLDPGVIAETLTPVALLHDIGKTQDDKSAEIAHPITGRR